MNPPAPSPWRRWLGLMLGHSEGDRSSERYRRALLTTLASGVAKAGGLLAMLVLVPVLLSHLGAERLGVWLTLSSLSVLVGFADLGMGTGLMTIVARASGSQRDEEAQRAISSCFFVLLGLGGALVLVFSVVNPWLPWSRLLRTSSDLPAVELRDAMLAFGITTLAGLPFSIVERVQAGNQAGFASQLWQGAGTLVGLAGVLVAISAGAGLAGVLWAGLGARALTLVANSAWYFHVERPELCPRWRWYSRATASEMIRLGLIFLWLNLLAFNWWLVDPIVITRALGSEAVAGYGAMQRLFAVGLVGQYLVMPLWPAFGEALARGDLAWVRSSLKRALTLTLGLTAALGLGLVVFGGAIARVWLEGRYAPPISLLTGMAALNLVLMVAWSLSGVLVHGEFLRRQAIWYTVAAVVALTLKLVWVRSWGLPGVVWASVLAFGLVYVPMAARLTREAVRADGEGGITERPSGRQTRR